MSLINILFPFLLLGIAFKMVQIALCHLEEETTDDAASAAATPWIVESFDPARGDLLISREDLKKWQLQLMKQPNVHTRPLAEFHPFPKLPAELRIKIWKLALEEPRTIELETRRVSVPEFLNHKDYKVSRKSRQPPAILHVNHEARFYGLEVYQKIRFDTRAPMAGTAGPRSPLLEVLPQIFPRRVVLLIETFVALRRKLKSKMSKAVERRIYFNPERDIVYFGQKTCMSTIMEFVVSTHKRALAVPRIAIHIEITKALCRCGWHNQPRHGRIGYTPAEFTMCVLRGIPSVIRAPVFPLRAVPGYRGLEEISFVFPSSLWKDGDNIGPDVGFREVVGSGLTEFHSGFRKIISDMFRNLQDPKVLEQLAPNWVGRKMPSFNFVNMAAPSVGTNQFNAMPMDFGKMIKLADACSHGEDNAWNEFRHLAQATGVGVLIGEFGFQDQEVAFFGSTPGIAKCKQLLEWRFARDYEPDPEPRARGMFRRSSSTTLCPVAARKEKCLQD